MNTEKGSAIDNPESKIEKEQEQAVTETRRPNGSASTPLSANRDAPLSSLGLSDLLNFTTAILALVGAAILYIVGWVYEAYWYGFFGINLSQINIAPPQTMVESVPSVLIILLTLLLTIFVYRIYWTLRNKEEVTEAKTGLDSTPMIMLLGASFSVIAVIIFILWNWKYIQPLPIEIIVSTLALIVIVIFMFFIVSTANPQSTIRLFFALSEFQMSLSVGANLSRNSILDTFLEILEENETFKRLIRNIESRGQAVSGVLRNAWRLWVGFIVVFFLLLTVTLAAIFGRADAHFIQRPMLGSWQANEIFVYSSAKEKLPLNLSSPEFTEQGYEYGPFALIANDDQVYYLAEWKTERYYSIRPNVYIVPRSNDSVLIVLFEPQPTPVPLPSPTATVQPVITSTPTFTPSATITSMP